MSNLEFNHIISQVNEIEKKRAKERRLEELENVYDSFSTVEYYSIKKLIVLHAYLSDLAIDYPHDTKNLSQDTISGRIYTQLSTIKQILNLPDSIPCVVDEHNLIVLNAYGYRSEHCKARLYGRRNTMTRISRQCRFYLFKELYYDIDLKNAHPSMLLHYALTNGFQVPELNKYVTNRDAYLKEIAISSNITTSEAKTQLLRTINLVSESSVPQKLKALHREILPVRNHLYNSNMGENPTDLGKYCLTRESFVKRGLEQRKVSLQSHYCTSEESKCLHVLREVCLHKGKLDNIAKLSKNTRNLSFIPFFDGAYIYFDILSSKEQVQQIIDDTNKLIAPYVFELKSIEPEWDYIDEKDLQSYEKIVEILGSLSSNHLEKLLQLLDIPNFSLDDSKLDIILAGLTTQESKSDFSEGIPEEFNIFLENSAIEFKYRVRRSLLSYFKQDKVPELMGLIESLKPDKS